MLPSYPVHVLPVENVVYSILYFWIYKSIGTRLDDSGLVIKDGDDDSIVSRYHFNGN
jgi:hypothetical protein